MKSELRASNAENGFKPSPFQQRIFDWVHGGSGNGLCEAVAGSGKTTTLLQALNYIQRIVFLAFNKSIATELKQRAPGHVHTMTINSLGHQAVMKHITRPKIEFRKTISLIRAYQEDAIQSLDLSLADWRGFEQNLRKLVSLAKSSGLVPESVRGNRLLEDSEENWRQIIDHHDLRFPGTPWADDEEGEDDSGQPAISHAIDIARAVLSDGLETRFDGIEFDDQIYLPVVLNFDLPKYDWILVDEAQDLSPMQNALIAKAAHEDTRFLFVGDRRQAIYAFRGADHNSLSNIEKKFSTEIHPLSISYRCPKKVVELAKAVVPTIEPFEHALEGEIEHLETYEKLNFYAGSLVVCRSNAPLVKLTYHLLSKRIGVKLLGRDICEMVISVIEKIKPIAITVLPELLDLWHEKEIAKARKRNPDADLSYIDDKKEVIEVLLNHTKATAVSEFISEIEAIFSKTTDEGSKAINPNTVNLATIHKAKGLEADTVYFLDRDRIPSRYAKKPHQIEQENNLYYVGVTRAKKRLVFISTPTKEEKKWKTK